MDKETKTFGRYDNGFTLKFDNGLVLSTRFGGMNYCENKAQGGVLDYLAREPSDAPLFSDDAEVAVWFGDSTPADNNCEWENGWQTAIFGDESPTDDVRGHIIFSEWLQVVDWCRNWQSE